MFKNQTFKQLNSLKSLTRQHIEAVVRVDYNLQLCSQPVESLFAFLSRAAEHIRGEVY